MLTVVVSCKNNVRENPHNYSITRYQRIEEGYQYSKDIFTYHSNIYRPIVTSEYVNDTLASVWIFKPEGKIKYNSADIKADTLLLQMLNVPHKRSIEIKEAQLVDNGKVNQLTESIKDSLYSIQKDTLFVYTIN